MEIFNSGEWGGLFVIGSLLVGCVGVDSGRSVIYNINIIKIEVGFSKNVWKRRGEGRRYVMYCGWILFFFLIEGSVFCFE